MRTLRSWLGLVGALALAGLPTPAGAQPVGEEFQVNTYTTNNQLLSQIGGRSIAADASGNFVVVWKSAGQDGNSYGIFGQRYDSQGLPEGAEFRVNTFTNSGQQEPAVAAAANGDFVVVWHSYSGQDGNGAGIFGQRYDHAGTALGGEFRVNSYTNANQFFPDVSADAAGNFVVVWMSDQDGSAEGIFGQRYDSEGVTLGGEFRVNSYTSFRQQLPSVATDASGNFVVAWNSFSQDGSHYGIFGRRYDSTGVPQGGEFQVNSFTTGEQNSASVAADASGNFVIVWFSFDQDGSRRGVFGQRYDSVGVALGGEFQVNSFTPGSQWFPSVASDAGGNFIVAWETTFDGAGFGISGQRYDSEGVAQGAQFQVNTYTTDDQEEPSAAANGPNRFVVVWSSDEQDGDEGGVFGQRYDFSGESSTIHVGDLDRRAKNVGASWRAQVKTLAHDDGHSAESGVLVTFNVSGGVGTRACTTTAIGMCEVSVVVSDSVPRLTFTVTNLSKAGFSYAPGANHDPDPDSNGTVIVVNQP